MEQSQALYPADEIKLCALTDIDDGGSRGFLREGNEDRVFAVRQAGNVEVYLNSCPHVWRPLEYRHDRFLSAQRDQIICHAHGARFSIASGLCHYGPCMGERLLRVEASVRDGDVYIRLPLPAPPH